MTSNDSITKFSYYIGVDSPSFPDPDAGQPRLDFFLEIPAEVKLTVAGATLTGVTEQDDDLMRIAKMISAELYAIRIRTRYSNLTTFLFHSDCQLTRDEMSNLIKTIERKRLMEARCLL